MPRQIVQIYVVQYKEVKEQAKQTTYNILQAKRLETSVERSVMWAKLWQVP